MIPAAWALFQYLDQREAELHQRQFELEKHDFLEMTKYYEQLLGIATELSTLDWFQDTPAPKLATEFKKLAFGAIVRFENEAVRAGVDDYRMFIKQWSENEVDPGMSEMDKRTRHKLLDALSTAISQQIHDTRERLERSLE